MALRFTTLASGSSGNATLVQANGFGLLLDAGLGPRLLARRLAAVGASWQAVDAVLLTHTHSDHWNDRTLAHLCRLGKPLYRHARHHGALEAYCSAYAGIAAAGLLRPFEERQPFTLGNALTCCPLAVRHDGGATFGFRIEAASDLFGHSHAIGYVADLGCWDEELVNALTDVDLLAVEFNHDVQLEYRSGRSPYLIARVLGAEGHLSNEQAAELLAEVVRRSMPGRLKHVVQLHLSRDCNRPELAKAAADHALSDLGCKAAVHTASQDEPGPTLHVGTGLAKPRILRPARNGTSSRRKTKTSASPHPWLPGFDSETA